MCTRYIDHRGLHFEIDTDQVWGEPEAGHDLVRCESDQDQNHCFKLATHRVNLKNLVVVRMCEDCIKRPLPVGSHTIERITGARWTSSSQDLRDGGAMARRVSTHLNKVGGMRARVTTKLYRTEEDGWTFKVSSSLDDSTLVSIALIRMTEGWTHGTVTMSRSNGRIKTIKVARAGDPRQLRPVSEDRWDQTVLAAREVQTAEFHEKLMAAWDASNTPQPLTDTERLAKIRAVMDDGDLMLAQKHWAVKRILIEA
jgi:hypothetical protein